jgi:hypothetical protein
MTSNRAFAATRTETMDERASEPRVNTGEHGSEFSGIRVFSCLPVVSIPGFTRGSAARWLTARFLKSGFSDIRGYYAPNVWLSSGSGLQFPVRRFKFHVSSFRLADSVQQEVCGLELETLNLKPETEKLESSCHFG